MTRLPTTVRQFSLILAVSFGLGAAPAYAIDPQPRPGGPAPGAREKLETAYFYGLAARINALVDDPPNRVAMDQRLREAGLTVSSLRRRFYNFVASPWYWNAWPPIDRVEYLATLLNVPPDELLRPDLITADFGVRGRFRAVDAQKTFQAYVAHARKAECTGVLTTTP